MALRDRPDRPGKPPKPPKPPTVPRESAGDALRGGGYRSLREGVASLAWRLAIIVAGAGVLLTAVQLPELATAERIAQGTALLLLVLAVSIAATFDTLRRLRADVTGGYRYDQMRGLRRLRIASVALQLLQITATVVVAVLAAVPLGLFELTIDADLVLHATRVLCALLATATAVALGQSLLVPSERARTPLASVLGILGLSAGAILGVLGISAALDATGSLEPWLRIGPDNAGSLVLAGLVGAAFATGRLRQLPNLTTLIDVRAGATGRSLDPSRRAAVVVPAILAFSLLLVVFLLFLLFGIGVGDLVLTAGRSPLLLAVLGFLVLALLVSLVLAFTLARGARGEQPLYRVLPDAEVRRRRTILTTSGLAAGAFLTLAALAFLKFLPEVLAIHFLCFGLMSALGPYGFHAAREYGRIRRLEERFPDFLRDIASSHKGGLTLHQAASIAAKGEYGDLTPEVRKMADQLSWNVSFSEALERFAERVDTPLVQRAVSLILQADRSGGSTTDVLLTAARDAREIKNLENERRTTMGLYTVVVYITFFVFLGVAAVLYAQFAPQIVAASTAVQEASLGSGSLEGPIGGGGGIELKDYELFYFLAAVVQGLGDGMVAGLLGTGKAALGLRHSFFMVLISYVTFGFLL